MTDPTPEFPPAETVQYEPLPPVRHDAGWFFFGADGLRAGWGILFFIILLVGISFIAQTITLKLQHKDLRTVATEAAAAKAAAKTQPQPSAPPPVQEQTPRAAYTQEALGFALVLLITYLMARIEHRPNRVFGFGGVHRLPQFLQGLVWGLVCLSLLVLMLKIGGFLHFDKRLLDNPATLRYSFIWALGFVLVACFEESLLRGYLQYTLARGLAGIYGAIFKTRHRHALGFWTAALFLSFIFGLGHGSNPGESPLGLIAAGTVGLVFCLALYRTGSLWWALGFHASWDWAQSFLYGVADSGTMVKGHLFATHPSGAPWLSGGLTGPEGSVLILPVLILVTAIIAFTLPRTHRPGEGLAHPDI